MLPPPKEWRRLMENGDRPFLKTELALVERLRQAAREDMDGLEILKLIEQIEDEIRRRGFSVPGRVDSCPLDGVNARRLRNCAKS